MKRIAIVCLVTFIFAAMVDGALTAQTDDMRWYYSNYATSVVLPGQPVVLGFNAGLAASVRVRLYRLPVAVELDWMRYPRYQLRSKDLAQLELVRTVAAKSVKSNLYASIADFGKVENGNYLAAWENPSSNNRSYGSTTRFEVGSLGSIWHAAGKTVLVYAVDLRSMRHRSDVQYTLIHPDGSRIGLVVFNGLSWLHGQEPGGSLLLGRASDGSTTMQSVYEYGQPYSAYVQTDRPIYRVGQHVFVRAILRNGAIGSYAIPTGSIRVQVKGPDGTLVYDKQRHLSSFGTLSADVELPLSAQLGNYQISAGSAVSSFSVEAYKKPEYLILAKALKPFVVGGDVASFSIDAKYFFGRPAAGMHISYVASRDAYSWGWYNPYARYIQDSYAPYREAEQIAQGEAKTDAAGQLHIDIPTKHLDADDTVTLHVEGRDDSGRTVSTEVSAQIVPSSFRIFMMPDRWYAQLGEDVTVRIDTKDYYGRARPNAKLTVEVSGDRWSYATHKAVRIPVFKDVIQTDGNGIAKYLWHPHEAGSYTFHVTGKDERGYEAHDDLWFWVSSPNEAWWYPNQQITLIPDKETYRPGEAAHILLTTPQADADALQITSSDKIESARLIHVSSKPQTITVVPPRDATTYRVVVEVPGKDGIQSGEVTINVSPPPRALSVTLVPDKPKYQPGERAHFHVSVKDGNGKGVHAELGVGVVDESIYAVKEDAAQTALAQFYSNRVTYFQSSGSWWHVAPVLKEIGSISWHSASDLVRAGTTADTYSVNASSQAAVARLGGGGNLNNAYSAIAANQKPRSYFPDTAFWTPDLETDKSGNATISFDWPDTLTTWRATGVAVDKQTSVGAGKGSALVTKDFLVRLEMPRFLRRGDESTFTGIVNGRPVARAATLHLDAGDLLRAGSPDATLSLDTNATASYAWLVNPLTSLGVRDIALSGTDGSLTDALRLPIPIEAAGAAEHVRDAGEAHDRNSVTYALPQLYDSGALHIALAPSIVASLVQNVELLDVYPYDCTEQTMSAALPAVFVDRMLKRTGLSAPQDSPATATIIGKAVRRLAELQHDDGSWGWWESDVGHPFMTAYALYGLAEFKKAGYDVPQTMIDRGINSAVTQVKAADNDTLRFWGGRQSDSEWNTRAFMLFALADAAPQRVDRDLLAQTVKAMPKLNDYALAVLGLTLHELKDDSGAKTILAQLNAREVDDGAYTFWLGQTWHYAWEDDPIESTAYALRLNTALEPGSARVKRIVNFLRSQQHGNWWYTTKDTAAAVYAISETVPTDSSEFHPNENVAISIGDRVVRKVHIDRALLDAGNASIDVPASDLEHGGTLSFSVSGRGALYWATDWTRYAPPYARKVADAQESILSRLRAKPSSFSIDRKYEAKRWPWQVGDEVTIDTTVRADADTDYVAIEDPFPAGAEYQPLQGEAGNNWSGLQFFDDRVVFFADHLYANDPLHLRYTLRVTTPGTYTASPPIAYAMYGPPVSTVGQPDKVTIR